MQRLCRWRYPSPVFRHRAAGQQGCWTGPLVAARMGASRWAVSDAWREYSPLL